MSKRNANQPVIISFNTPTPQQTNGRIRSDKVFTNNNNNNEKITNNNQQETSEQKAISDYKADDLSVTLEKTAINIEDHMKEQSAETINSNIDQNSKYI